MFRFLCPVVLNLNFLMVREGVFLCFLDKNAGIYAGMVLLCGSSWGTISSLLQPMTC